MHVESFDNLDDMFARIQEGVEQAKSRATDEQNAITYGDYWVRLWKDLFIFGYIMTEDELYSGSAYDNASEEEIAYEKEQAKRTYADGFRFGQAYSIVVPDGELGDTHVSTMQRITKNQFEAAKLCDWEFDWLLLAL